MFLMKEALTLFYIVTKKGVRIVKKVISDFTKENHLFSQSYKKFPKKVILD